MLSATRHKKLLLALILLAGSAVVAFAACRIRDALLFSRLSETEKKVVGAWSWTYLEGVGRMIFTADHRVKAGFPPPDSTRPAVRDRDFEYLLSGTWRVEGDILTTEIDNHLLLEMLSHRTLLQIVFFLPRNSFKPEFEKKIHREKIVSIDGNKIVFEGDHSPLQRVYR
ncbi:MAG: hypothetical protein QOH01_803 [Verrucomicrobiota bacterium]|jgi:hypothetical protein